MSLTNLNYLAVALLRDSLCAQAVTISEQLHHAPLYHRPRDVYTQVLCADFRMLDSKSTLPPAYVLYQNMCQAHCKEAPSICIRNVSCLYQTRSCQTPTEAPTKHFCWQTKLTSLQEWHGATIASTGARHAYLQQTSFSSFVGSRTTCLASWQAYKLSRVILDMQNS